MPCVFNLNLLVLLCLICLLRLPLFMKRIFGFVWFIFLKIILENTRNTILVLSEKMFFHYKKCVFSVLYVF